MEVAEQKIELKGVVISAMTAQQQLRPRLEKSTSNHQLIHHFPTTRTAKLSLIIVGRGLGSSAVDAACGENCAAGK
jgi:hypothetical protein